MEEQKSVGTASGVGRSVDDLRMMSYYPGLWRKLGPDLNSEPDKFFDLLEKRPMTFAEVLSYKGATWGTSFATVYLADSSRVAGMILPMAASIDAAVGDQLSQDGLVPLLAQNGRFNQLFSRMDSVSQYTIKDALRSTVATYLDQWFGHLTPYFADLHAAEPDVKSEYHEAVSNKAKELHGQDVTKSDAYNWEMAKLLLFDDYVRVQAGRHILVPDAETTVMRMLKRKEGTAPKAEVIALPQFERAAQI